jgi:hypothetical protein
MVTALAEEFIELIDDVTGKVVRFKTRNDRDDGVPRRKACRAFLNQFVSPAAAS